MIMTAQSDARDERLSALMDGEIHGAEIDRAIGELKQNPELSARWGRYHLVSDSLRNDIAAQVDPGMADRINAVIAAEPIYTSAHHWRGKRSPAWLKQAGGLAIAASVTAVAILGTQSLYQTDSNRGNGPAIASTSSTGSTPADSSYKRRLPDNIELASYREQPQWSPVAQSHFNRLLLSHQDYQAGHTLRGSTLPYLRLVNTNAAP